MIDQWLELFLKEVPLTPEMGEPLTDEEALKLALVEGARGFGFTSPNPAVGCVILDAEGQFLSSGYHARTGEAHAEINALEGLSDQVFEKQDDRGWNLSHLPKERLVGARVFVTLEPCAHEGRTPSCAKTLAQLPIAEVTAILKDPFPQVAGKGFEILKAAKIRVKCLEDQGAVESYWTEAGRALCEFFLINTQKARPQVSLKVATSLDGMMALKNGQSQWITSGLSRSLARFLRGAHEAVIVGKHTVLLDNPRLDARETPFADCRRKVIVLDSTGEVLSRPDLQIFQLHRPDDLFVCVGTDCPIRNHERAQILVVSKTPKFDWAELLRQLFARQIRSVWIEGGARTLSSALEAGIADRLWLFQGPHLLGGAYGRPWTEAWGQAQMEHRLTLDGVRHLSLDQDLLTTGRLSNSKT